MSTVLRLFADDCAPVVNRRQYGPYTVPHLPSIRAERRAEAARLAQEIDTLRLTVHSSDCLLKIRQEASARLAELLSVQQRRFPN